jgi:hypothetical protein
MHSQVLGECSFARKRGAPDDDDLGCGAHRSSHMYRVANHAPHSALERPATCQTGGRGRDTGNPLYAACRTRWRMSVKPARP